ncbi:hypothetical protein OC845_006289 [Tilletia horrida]|nr:hypothetical protein OC845_006289 [Tilletia horrida]
MSSHGHGMAFQAPYGGARLDTKKPKAFANKLNKWLKNTNSTGSGSSSHAHQSYDQQQHSTEEWTETDEYEDPYGGYAGSTNTALNGAYSRHRTDLSSPSGSNSGSAYTELQHPLRQLTMHDRSESPASTLQFPWSNPQYAKELPALPPPGEADAHLDHSEDEQRYAPRGKKKRSASISDGLRSIGANIGASVSLTNLNALGKRGAASASGHDDGDRSDDYASDSNRSISGFLGIGKKNGKKAPSAYPPSASRSGNLRKIKNRGVNSARSSIDHDRDQEQDDRSDISRAGSVNVISWPIHSESHSRSPSFTSLSPSLTNNGAPNAPTPGLYPPRSPYTPSISSSHQQLNNGGWSSPAPVTSPVNGRRPSNASMIPASSPVGFRAPSQNGSYYSRTTSSQGKYPPRPRQTPPITSTQPVGRNASPFVTPPVNGRRPSNSSAGQAPMASGSSSNHGAPPPSVLASPLTAFLFDTDAKVKGSSARQSGRESSSTGPMVSAAKFRTQSGGSTSIQSTRASSSSRVSNSPWTTPELGTMSGSAAVDESVTRGVHKHGPPGSTIRRVPVPTVDPVQRKGSGDERPPPPPAKADDKLPFEQSDDEDEDEETLRRLDAMLMPPIHLEGKELPENGRASRASSNYSDVLNEGWMGLDSWDRSAEATKPQESTLTLSSVNERIAALRASTHTNGSRKATPSFSFSAPAEDALPDLPKSKDAASSSNTKRDQMPSLSEKQKEKESSATSAAESENQEHLRPEGLQLTGLGIPRASGRPRIPSLALGSSGAADGEDDWATSFLSALSVAGKRTSVMSDRKRKSPRSSRRSSKSLSPLIRSDRRLSRLGSGLGDGIGGSTSPRGALLQVPQLDSDTANALNQSDDSSVRRGSSETAISTTPSSPSPSLSSLGSTLKLTARESRGPVQLLPAARKQRQLENTRSPMPPSAAALALKYTKSANAAEDAESDSEEEGDDLDAVLSLYSEDH